MFLVAFIFSAAAVVFKESNSLSLSSQRFFHAFYTRERREALLTVLRESSTTTKREPTALETSLG